MGASEPLDKIVERGVDRIGERGWQAHHDRRAQCVADSGCVLAGADSFFARDRCPKRSAFGDQGFDEAVSRGGCSNPSGEFDHRLRTKFSQHIVKLVCITRRAMLDQPLEFELQVGHEVLVQCQSCGPALGQGRIALIHVGGDPAEQQRLRERRRLWCFDRLDADRAVSDSAHDLAQRGQVEDVVDALANGLQQDREVGVVLCRLQQVGGPLALLPERGATVRTSFG